MLDRYTTGLPVGGPSVLVGQERAFTSGLTQNVKNVRNGTVFDGVRQVSHRCTTGSSHGVYAAVQHITVRIDQY